jgi:hypothetical protein
MTLRIAVLVAWTLLAAAPAYAAFFVSDSGAALPTTIRADHAATVTITWTLVADTPNDNVTSTAAIFIVDGNQIPAAVPNLSGFTDLTNRVQFQETIVIPYSVVAAAAQSTGVVAFQRPFSTSTGDYRYPLVNFRIGGGLGGEPRIQSIELHFDDGAQTKIIASTDEVHAVAELTLANVSRLRGVWEVSIIQAKTPQDLIFQTIATVDQHVQYKRNLVTSSPALPAAIPGEHVVRFRPTEPALVGAVPEITYSVGGPQSGDLGSHPPPAVTGPSAGARLTTGTRIRWMEMPGIAYWELQFFRDTHSAGRLGVRPVAGVRLRSNEIQVRLRSTTLARLERGRTYYWRLVGLDARGRVLTKSPLRANRT